MICKLLLLRSYFSIQILLPFQDSTVFMCLVCKHKRLIYNTICKPYIVNKNTGNLISSSFASTVFLVGGAKVHEFTIPPRGTILYRAQDPKALSQNQSKRIHTLV
jgi:hypothetical protein